MFSLYSNANHNDCNTTNWHYGPTYTAIMFSGPSLDSVFTTAADSSHFEPKKGKKTRVIQVKECVETIDNVHNEALVKPRTPFASPVNEARRRSVPRCVSFLNMADGARDVSTPAEARTSSARKSSKARSTSTPPNSACSSAKARAVSSPPTSARKSTATRPPSAVCSGAQSRTASKPPSSPGKKAKAQRSSYSRRSAKSRTASSPPSSAHMDIEIETSAPSRESSALSDYSDITILSNITILSAPRSQAPQAKTSSDIYSDDFEETTDEFGADSDSTLGQNKYESDFETDSNESIEDQSPPQKPEKKSHVPNAKPAEPSNVVFHANEKDDWRPKTSATYCIARTPDSENSDHAIGPRGKKQHWTRPHIQSPEILHLETPRKGTPGVGRNNVSPIMPTITMWNGYEADSEEDEKCVVGRKANNKSDFEPVVPQPTPTRIETPEDSFFYELQDGSYESQFNKTPDFLQLTPPRKPFELPDANFLVDIFELTYEPTLKMGSESSRPATRMNLETLRDSANDGRMQSAPNATTNEDVGNPDKCDDYDPTVDASGSESQRIMKTPTDEEFFDRPPVVEEPPSIQSGEVTPAYTNRNYDDMSAERKVLNMNGRGTPAPFSEERKELVKKLRPKSVTVIGKGLMAREEDIRIRNKTKITYSRNPEEEVKAEKVRDTSYKRYITFLLFETGKISH